MHMKTYEVAKMHIKNNFEVTKIHIKNIYEVTKIHIKNYEVTKIHIKNYYDATIIPYNNHDVKLYWRTLLILESSKRVQGSHMQIHNCQESRPARTLSHHRPGSSQSFCFFKFHIS